MSEKNNQNGFNEHYSKNYVKMQNAYNAMRLSANYNMHMHMSGPMMPAGTEQAAMSTRFYMWLPVIKDTRENITEVDGLICEIRPISRHGVNVAV